MSSNEANPQPAEILSIAFSPVTVYIRVMRTLRDSCTTSCAIDAREKYTSEYYN